MIFLLQNVQSGPVAHPGSNLIGAREWGSWSVNLIIFLHLVLKLRMSVVTLLMFLHASSVHRDNFVIFFVLLHLHKFSSHL